MIRISNQCTYFVVFSDFVANTSNIILDITTITTMAEHGDDLGDTGDCEELDYEEEYPVTGAAQDKDDDNMEEDSQQVRTFIFPVHNYCLKIRYHEVGK